MSEKHRCSKYVWDPTMSRFYLCQRNGTFDHDGMWWCKQHHKTIEAEAKAREAKRAAENAAKAADRKRIENYDAVYAAATDMYLTCYPWMTDERVVAARNVLEAGKI
jgi:radical SAM superfamily enzyme